MGCLQSKTKGDKDFKDQPTKQIDSRLPFENYRQFFNTKNSWKTVSRKLTECSQQNLLLFFERFPQHKTMFKEFENMSEEQLKNNLNFTNMAEAVFLVFDEVMQKCESNIGNVDEAVRECIKAGQKHEHIPGFNVEFFKDMEDTFIYACRQALEDRFTESTENNFKLLYGFVIYYMAKSLQIASNESNRI